MRILTITNYYPPNYIGGYEIACRETMEYLKSKGHQIKVVTSDYGDIQSCDTKDVLRAMRLTDYSRKSRFNKILNEYHNFAVVKSTIRSFQPDIVYFWSLRGIGVGVIMAAESLSIPKVFEIGDFWMKGYMNKSSGLKQRFKSLLPKRYTSQPNISPAICVSNWVANEMRENYNTNQTFTIPNATYIKSEISPIQTFSTRFIFAGRIDEEKGLDLAIEALKLFTLKHPYIDFYLDIYGEGDAAYTKKCITLAEPINHRIHFRGKAKTKDEMYKSGGILLMPTRMREPFGLVIIEAMAHGCAIIASNAYGPAEIINHEENGLLFVPEDHFDLMRNIEKIVLDSDLFQTLRTNGFKHVAFNYNINSVKPKVEALLGKIAGVAL